MQCNTYWSIAARVSYHRRNTRLKATSSSNKTNVMVRSEQCILHFVQKFAQIVVLLIAILKNREPKLLEHVQTKGTNALATSEQNLIALSLFALPHSEGHLKFNIDRCRKRVGRMMMQNKQDEPK